MAIEEFHLFHKMSTCKNKTTSTEEMSHNKESPNSIKVIAPCASRTKIDDVPLARRNTSKERPSSVPTRAIAQEGGVLHLTHSSRCSK